MLFHCLSLAFLMPFPRFSFAFPFVAPLPALRFRVQGLGVRIMAPRPLGASRRALAEILWLLGLLCAADFDHLFYKSLLPEA